VVASDGVTTLRDQAIAPLSRADAERLLQTLPLGRQTLERRVLRARCLKYLGSFDVAWAGLTDLMPAVKDPMLRARVAVDLVHLAYYLARADEAARLTALAQDDAAGDPLLLAELRLGTSINLTAANDITGALTEARWAEDALVAAPRGRSRDLVMARLQRQLAHLHSHAADYRAAKTAADMTVRLASRINDAWESASGTYVLGFAAWYGGRTDEAVEHFTKAEGVLSPYRSSLWRYTLLCLSAARMQRGELAEGDRLARQSATGASEDLAHLALLRGDAEVAERILARAPKGSPADEHFRDFVRGIVRAQQGDPRAGIRMLEDLASEFGSRGMEHWAIGASVHAAYWREQVVRGAGAARAAHLVRDIGARGGEGFAYYLPEVAVWLGRAAERDAAAGPLARSIRARGESAIRRAQSDADVPLRTSKLDEATFHLRASGLTWRELGILRELERVRGEGAGLDRAMLAARLGVSPNTLRVHLTRIRAKLDVGDKRGDEVLLEAALAQSARSA